MYRDIVLSSSNAFEVFEKIAQKFGEQQALYEEKNNSSYSFQCLYDKIIEYSEKFAFLGIGKGEQVIIAIEHSIDFVAVSFALFRLGAVPIFIDSGMGRKNVLACVEQSRAKMIVSSSFKALLLARIYRKKAFKFTKIFLSVKKSFFFRSFSQVKRKEINERARIELDDFLALVFTSGSTGKAKGAYFSHKMFLAQMRIIYESYSIHSQQRNLSIYPLVTLLTVCMGMDTYIPKINFSKLISNNPKKILNFLDKHKIEFSFGSPTFWNKITDWAIENERDFSCLKSLLLAGCSVDHHLLKKIKGKELLAKNGEIHIPYGATEALPVSSASAENILSYSEKGLKEGKGTYLGELADEETEVLIIAYQEEELSNFKESKVLKENEIGEIIVYSSVVSPSYFGLDKGKIIEEMATGGKKIWHRMGDMGYFDKNKRLWLCGRKADIIFLGEKTYYTDQCENIFNAHELVYRSALIQEKDKPLLLVEVQKKITRKEKSRLFQELFELGSQYEVSKGIRSFKIYKSFPVDIRHNAKIKRDLLRLEFNK